MDIESADVAFDIVAAVRNAARSVRRADDHDVLGNDGRRMQPYFAGDGIDLLIVILLQIDDTVVAEGGCERAVLGVESDEPVAGRDVEDSFFLAVGPVGESTA